MMRQNDSAEFRKTIAILCLVMACMSLCVCPVLAQATATKEAPIQALFRPTLFYQQPIHPRFTSLDDNCHKQIPVPKTTAFFCRLEENIEKNSRIAFRFRLGSLNYVNMLENKGKDY